MTISREEIAAFADGELDQMRHAHVAAAIAADPKLAEQVRSHQALREQLSAHFAPILGAPLPEQLVRPLKSDTNAVIDLAAARRERRSRRPARWTWVAGSALAASLALALLIPGQDHVGMVQGELAAALDYQLVSTQTANSPQRILLSFRSQGGKYCRAFASEGQGGIACREAGGWRLEEKSAGTRREKSDYRMAGNPNAQLLERAQAMAAGPALDASQERLAREHGWR